MFWVISYLVQLQNLDLRIWNHRLGKHCCCCLVAQLCPNLATPWTVAQAPLWVSQARILEWLLFLFRQGCEDEVPGVLQCVYRSTMQRIYKNSLSLLLGFIQGNIAALHRNCNHHALEMQIVALCIELLKMPRTKGRSSKARVRTVTAGPVWHRPFRRVECLHYGPSLGSCDWYHWLDKNPFQFLWIEDSIRMMKSEIL